MDCLSYRRGRLLSGLGRRRPKDDQRGGPIPLRVIATDGNKLFEGSTIQDGQNVWQSLGGQEAGSIWGHGAYVAPNWSADWLHREAVFILDTWARQEGVAGYAALNAEHQAALRARLRALMRTNIYDAATGFVTVDPVRVEAFNALAAHYPDVFSQGRPEYAIPRGALMDSGKQRQLAAFFWWTSWASSTNRPGFYVVVAMWVIQVALGAITAHYGVEGSGFYGFPLDRWLPYSITRTWHLQLGTFWIATSWTAPPMPVIALKEGKSVQVAPESVLRRTLLEARRYNVFVTTGCTSRKPPACRCQR